jgi:dipeptidyl aminopeptidase/acylaminoacyl peptidase
MSKLPKQQLLFTLLCAFFAVNIATHIPAQKKTLDHTVYDSWKNLKNIKLTDNGRYVLSIVAPQEGDNSLLVKDVLKETEFAVERVSNYEIIPNSNYVIATIKPFFADTREAKIKKTKDEKMPKDTLGIVNMQTKKTVKIPMLKSFKIGTDFSEYVAYALDDTVKSKKETNTLILRHIERATEDTIKNVSNYIFSKNGKFLAVTTKVSDKDSVDCNVVLYYDLSKNSHRIVSENKKEYLMPALSEDGLQLSFLATTDSAKKEIKEYALYYFNAKDDSARMIVDRAHVKMPENWEVSRHQTLSFSQNGKRLLFGVAPISLPKDTTIPDFEKATLDIWHWNEPEIPTIQLKNLDKEKKRTYLSFVNVDELDNFVQLAEKEIPTVVISQENDGRYAVGTSNLPYRRQSQWSYDYLNSVDVWVFDLENNTKKQLKEKLAGRPRLSYNGNYLVWYNYHTRNYYAYAMQSGEERCLTCDLDVRFWNDEYDMPSDPEPYGMSMWFEDDKAFLAYDKYDVWKLDPSGQNAPENLTKGEGRKKEITLRYVPTDPDGKYIVPKTPLLFSAFDNNTKKTGYYQLDGRNKLQKLIVDGYRFASLTKAKNKNMYAYLKSNFNTSPDLYVTPNNWKSEKKLTDINPQMKDYAWGSVELIEWTTFKGKQAKGLLYKPENFDENSKYPLLAYFYDRSSDELYRFYQPEPNWSIINIPFYVSRGYIVFVPDIYYTDGYPGESAYDFIISGVEKLAGNSWVNKDKMGMQGQSWGGYQVAYLITRTNLFAAAGAGAPVANMFSAYGGIRWESGRSRQYQYENGQSRIGKSIWEAPELYHENSPIFFADKVETPLLIMHNDNDGAVPWYQGIEYFMALRRLEKPVWMLQYNNEGHNLKERRNRKDLTVRLQQFFDHYLKDEPMPKWMKTGVPAIEKGKDDGFGYAED